MNYYLCLLLLFILGKAEEEYPEAYFTDDHYYPPPPGSVIIVTVYVFSSSMDFGNDLLQIEGLMNVMWMDRRKAKKSPDLIVFENLKNSTMFKRAMDNTWMPSLIPRMREFNFQRGELKRVQKLVVVPSGQLLYSMPIKLKIHCQQTSANFPFDTYACPQRIIVQESNMTARYINSQAFSGNVSRKNFGHRITEMKSRASTKRYGDEENGFNYQDLEFYFGIQRESPKLIATLIVPIIVIALMDSALFVLGKSAFTRLALLPAYCFYLDDISEANVEYEWPPIVKFFSARLVSCLLLSVWTLFNCLQSPVNPSQIRIYSQTLINSWQKRLIFQILLTCLFHALFSFNAFPYTEKVLADEQ